MTKPEELTDEEKGELQRLMEIPRTMEEFLSYDLGDFE
jgi:hypothetical protein